MNISDVTEEFLISKDHLNTVWLSDSWLSMRGMEHDKEKLALYDKIAEVKELVQSTGYLFKADAVEYFD